MQRVLGLLVLILAGILALPLSALPFDEEGSENWIIVVFFGGMAGVGALLAQVLPDLTGAEGVLRRTVLGALLGVAMSLVGLVVFFLLLNGFEGA